MKVYKVIPEKWTRNDFEISVVKNSKRASEITSLIESGALNPDDYVFSLEQLIEICSEVAGGFWDNATVQKDPSSKWGREMRGKQIKEAIKQAFTR